MVEKSVVEDALRPGGNPVEQREDEVRRQQSKSEGGERDRRGERQVVPAGKKSVHRVSIAMLTPSRWEYKGEKRGWRKSLIKLHNLCQPLSITKQVDND